MAIGNHERMGKAVVLLGEGLRHLAKRELKAQNREHWFEKAKRTFTHAEIEDTMPDGAT